MLLSFLFFSVFGLVLWYLAYTEFQYGRANPTDDNGDSNTSSWVKLALLGLLPLALGGVSLMAYFESTEIAATGHSEQSAADFSDLDVDDLLSGALDEQLRLHVLRAQETGAINAAVTHLREEDRRQFLLKASGEVSIRNLEDYPVETRELLEALQNLDAPEGKEEDLSDILLYEEQSIEETKVEQSCLGKINKRLGGSRSKTPPYVARSGDVVADVDYVLTNDEDEIGMPNILTLTRSFSRSQYPSSDHGIAYGKLLGLRMDYNLRLTIDGETKEESGTFVPDYDRHSWSDINDPYELIAQLTAEQLADRILILAAETE